MNAQRVLHKIDGISTWTGKAAAWLIMGLMLLVCAEVFKRYILNMPTAWIFDASNMMYGTLFMIGGAYTLAQNGHVRGDFLQLDAPAHAGLARSGALFSVLPAGYCRAAVCRLGLCRRFLAHQRTLQCHRRRAAGLAIQVHDPLAGALLLLQGAAEIMRCVICPGRAHGRAG
jgi:TRAP-type mannitol/chloroaromatic compound transport system permease small subunit